MHRSIYQIFDDLFALLCSQVLNALKSLNHVLSVSEELFLDIIKDDGHTGLDLIELLNIDMAVMV